MRAAQALSVEKPGSVSIIDFEGVDSDAPSAITPSSVNRIAWEKMLSIAIDDLSARVLPEVIVVCEGSSIGTRRKSFDAEIYNRVLGSIAVGKVFVSGGSSKQVAEAGGNVKSILREMAGSTRVVALCDRDDKSGQEVAEFERDGGVVLAKRNLGLKPNQRVEAERLS